MPRKTKLFASLAAALALPLMTFQSASAATTWIMATGNPENSFFTENIREFIKEVETNSKGELKIDLRSNDTLVKHDAIKRAVQSGQVQLGEIRLGVYGNEDPMYNLDNLPGVVTDYKQAKLLMDAQAPYFDTLFKKNRIRALSYVPWPGQGFFTKTALTTPEDMKGKKLRIYSQPTREMGEALGFQSTILPFAEVSQAYATGLINSLFTSAQTGIDTQIWDNAKYYTYTGTMHNKNVVIVSETAMRALPKAVQDVVIAAGERATTRGYEMSAEVSQKNIDVLKQHGMEVTDASASIQEKIGSIGKKMIEDWRNAANDEQRAVLDNYVAARDKAQ